jgi:hypothetical protein
MCRSYLGRHWGTENRKQHATYRNRLKNTDSNCAKSGLMSGLDTPQRIWGLFMVELIVADFFDYTFLGVVIVAMAIAILVVWINKQ